MYISAAFGWCSWLSRLPNTQKVPSSILGSNTPFLPSAKSHGFDGFDWGSGGHTTSILGRVVKAMDLSPIGQCPRGFEPRRMHGSFFVLPHFEELTVAGFNITHVRLAQWIRRLPTEQEIAGSNPAMDSSFCSIFFFLVRTNHHRGIWCLLPSSVPGWRNWQRSRLLTERSRVRASLWEFFCSADQNQSEKVEFKSNQITGCVRAG
jgi:hypothetical protein